MNLKLIDIFEEVEEFHWWFEGRREMLRRVFVDYLPQRKGVRILDVGCGTGGNMKFLAKWGKVWGVDNLRQAVVVCRKKRISRVRLADATLLPFGARKFEAVTFLDVLEHIEDSKKALIEAKRVVVPGGWVIITVPATPELWSKHDSMQGHQKRYTKNGLVKLASECGFEIVEVRYFNVFLMLPIAIVRILSRYGPFGRLGEYDSKINFDLAKIDAVNRILLGIFKLEIFLARGVDYPIGVSLLAVLRRK